METSGVRWIREERGRVVVEEGSVEGLEGGACESGDGGGKRWRGRKEKGGDKG